MDPRYVLDEMRASPFFADVEPAVLADMAAHARLGYFEARTLLFRQGEAADRMHLIVSGQVALGQGGEDGRQTVLRILGRGEIMAGIAALPDGVYPAAAEALERTGTLSWDAGFLRSLAQREASLTYALLRLVFARLDEAQSRLREMAYERTEQRLALTLMRLAGQMGVETEASGVRINLRLTRQMLAEMAGTTLFTASRLLSGWEKNGWLRSSPEAVAILEPHRLAQIAYGLTGRDGADEPV